MTFIDEILLNTEQSRMGTSFRGIQTVLTSEGVIDQWFARHLIATGPPTASAATRICPGRATRRWSIASTATNSASPSAAKASTSMGKKQSHMQREFSHKITGCVWWSYTQVWLILV